VEVPVFGALYPVENVLSNIDGFLMQKAFKIKQVVRVQWNSKFSFGDLL